MKITRNSFFFALLLCSVNSFAQYIQVNDTKTAQQLIEDILINSPCANVSNFSVNGDTFSPGAQSYGSFTSGTSGFPFGGGVVLSTSKAKRTEGPNDNLIDEGLTSWLGDTDLEQALTISNTYNATVLEFDFVPLTSKISFDYIFASEEYQGTAPCKYSDGFAFLLKEANSTNPYQNLALIPNTTIPVLVTSVHPYINGNNGCPAMNETYFGGYNGNGSPINFNGQTVVMKAKATVIPNKTYHIKLVIADHENIRYDSAIFLGAGSFKVETDLGPDRLIATQNPICQGKTYSLDATEPGASGYKWFKNGILDSSVTTALYSVTTSGVYSVEVSLGASTCKATGKVTIDFSPLPALVNTTIVQCDDNNDGTTTFNLTKVDNIIKNNDSSLGNVSYYDNLPAAQSQDVTQVILNPTVYSSVPKTIFASVSNAFGCASTASIILQISNNSVASFQDLETCDLDAIDGYYDFHLSDANTNLLQGLPSGLVVEYYPTMNDALVQTNLLPNLFRNTIQFQMTVYAKIVNGSDCYGIVPLHLFVNSIAPALVKEETVLICMGNTKILEMPTLFSTYSWAYNGVNLGDFDYQTQAAIAGIYTVTVSDANGCTATKKFIVTNSGPPTITSVTVNDFQDDANTVLIHFTGLGDYEFSLDGIHYQDSPYFTGVASGEYTLWANDKNHCGYDSTLIYVLNYPKYFTPNGDGFNDFWEIKNSNAIPNSEISIFDRFGKLVYQFKEKQKGWDGKSNSKNLPSSDYWFVLTLENGKTIKGHFSLKR